VRNLPFKVDSDFEYLGMINDVPMTLIGKPQLPANNYKELITWVNANKGSINLANAGLASASHLCGMLWQASVQVDMTTVPYKGTAPAMTDLIGGQVDLMFDAVTTMTEQVKAGKVRAIATTGRQRSEVLPDVPTLSEAGVPGYEATIWVGLMAPKGTPKDVVDRLNQAVSKIASQTDVRQQWAKQGAVPMVMNPAVFDKYIQDDVAKWAQVIRAANIKMD
jgi:tripartite-type tricarboxylate transporter receptor subunit TctC